MKTKAVSLLTDYERVISRHFVVMADRYMG